MSKSTTISVLAMAGIMAVVSFWLWDDHQQERTSHRQLLEVRAQTTLASLEAGIRSHRRMGRWFLSNIDSVLEESTTAPGILGMAVLDESGKYMGRGGEQPSTVTLSEERTSSTSELRPGGLLFLRKTILSAPQEQGDEFQGRGRGGGWGRRDQGDESMDALLETPVWLAAWLDRAEYDRALRRDARRFGFSMAITLAAVLAGLALTILMQRQAHLAAQISTGLERERRLEERSQMGAGLAHETKNPLSLIRGMAQAMATKSVDPDREVAEMAEECNKTGRQIMDEVDRVAGRINSFLEYARPQNPERAAVRLDLVLAETAALFQDEAASKGVTIETALKAVRAMADAGMFRQVIVNLLANALAACGEGDAIRLELRPAQSGGVELAIADNGTGIAPEDLPRVTKPYFTRRDGGTGLGLSIVEEIVQAHGWSLNIDSMPETGTEVRIANIATLRADGSEKGRS
jgi:two-component system, NtrC family, sensor histidine kinase HydH